jgi:acetylornithine/N-succinyldiaminopimelate aminotransferase
LVENSFAEKIFFTNSGTESTEGALKMAVKWGREIKKEKVEVLSSLNSFHGRSTGGLALTGQPEKQVPFEGLLPKFKHFNYNDIESFKAMLNENTCAVFLEAIQGEGGIVELDREFVKEMKKLQAKYNFLIIMDEIQAGLRRTAYELFAYEAYGVEPDIVTLAKGLGGGLPLGAILIGEKAVNTFGLGDHGTTFGGNPVACAAGNHIMSLMCDDDFVKKIEENAGYFRSKLEGLKNKYSVIEEIRGRGFMIGLEMGEYAEKTKNVALEKGMLLNVTAKTVLRLIPRINIPKEEIDEFVNKFEEILKTF